MKKVHLVLLILFLVGIKVVSFSQSAIQFSVFPGILVPHQNYMVNMAAHTFGAELGMQFYSTGNKERDSLYKNPVWGVSLYYNHLGKPSTNGGVWAINPYFIAPIKKHKRSTSSLRIGTGIGFYTKPFDLINNPKNKAIGSTVNGCMQFAYLNHRKISSKSNFYWGIGVTHFSNGNFLKPNLGINTPQINIGFEFLSPKSLVKASEKPLAQNEAYIEFRLGYASEQATLADPQRFQIYTLGITQGLPLSQIRSFRVGVDYFYDPLHAYETFNPSTLQGFKIQDVSELGLRIGHEYHLGMVSMTTDWGAYLFLPKSNSFKRRTYILIGVNFHLSEFNLSSRLKTHLGTADYFEFGAAYRRKSSFIPNLFKKTK